MWAVRRRTSASGLLGTSSAQKRTPGMPGISAVSANCPLEIPLREIVAAQPESMNATDSRSPTYSLGLNTPSPPVRENPLIQRLFYGTLKAGAMSAKPHIDCKLTVFGLFRNNATVFTCRVLGFASIRGNPERRFPPVCNYKRLP
jgi:hypothetical protein